MEFKEIQEMTKNVHALLCEEDKEALCRYAKEVMNGSIIVDIGTAAGGSAFIMALASKPNCRVFTIDPVSSEAFLHMRKKLGLEQKIYYFNEISTDAISHFQSADVDMLFIDGWHSYEAVMSDYTTFGSRVKQGGIIAFHDVLLYDNTIGKAVDDLIKDGKIKEIERIIGTYKEDIRKVGLSICEKL